MLKLIRREHDALLGLRHIGVLVPWANTVVEFELPRLGLTHIVWHYARLAPDNQGTALDDSFLRGLVRAVPGALHQCSRLPLAAVLLACTSVGFSYPLDVPVVSAFDALLAGLRRLGARRVLLLTPYPDDLAEREAKALEARGHTVVGHASLGWDDGFADVASDQIRALLGRFTPADAGGRRRVGAELHRVADTRRHRGDRSADQPPGDLEQPRSGLCRNVPGQVMRSDLRQQATEFSPMLSCHLFERVRSIAADPEVKAAVEDNHDENRWWPTAIGDWRLRMAVAGWGTRVSYHMIDTYAEVVAVAGLLGWERLTALPDRQIAGIVRPLGLHGTRVGYLRSLSAFLASLGCSGVDPLAMDVDEFVMRLARDVKYAGYNIAQCAALYSRGYHCGVIPVDSGMVTKLAPFLGIKLDCGAIAHEQLRVLLEACARDRGDAYRDLAHELGYQVIVPRGAHPTWWLHLVLVYFKRIHLNRPNR